MGIFRCRVLQVTATWRKLQNEEPHTSALETNIIAVSRSRMIIVCGIHSMHGGRCECRLFFSENLLGRACVGDRSASWMVI
jgi:hypothetical protein